MNDHLVADGSFINSIIGEGSSFKGDISLDGLLRIDGDYIGSIRTTGKVLIGKTGRAECRIQAGTVVVGGVVKGNIQAEELVVVLSSGMVIGNIIAPRMIIEDGVTLCGQCTVSPQPSSKPSLSYESPFKQDSEARQDAAPAVVEISERRYSL